jgi:hypothetical protein
MSPFVQRGDIIIKIGLCDNICLSEIGYCLSLKHKISN